MIDIKKKYRTQGGQQVRIYATDGSGKLPVHGAVMIDGGWVQDAWTAEGRYFWGQPEDNQNLVEVKEKVKVEGWLVMWSDKSTCLFASKQEAEDDLAQYTTMRGTPVFVSGEVEV